VAGDWSTSGYNTYYRQRGFLSTYSQDSDREDFAEVLSLYVTNTAEQLAEWLADAGRAVTEDDFDETKNKDHYNEFHTSFPDLKVGDTFPGRERILAKIDLVRKYFKDNFDVEIDELRDAVLRRQNDVLEGKVDLTSLEIN
jgi:substrate import-associated zinc metallohydrolase lipoprotein